MKRAFMFEGFVALKLPLLGEELSDTSTLIDMAVECEVSSPIGATWDSPAEGAEVEITDVYIDGLDKHGDAVLSYLWRITPTASGLTWLLGEQDIENITEEIYDRIEKDNWGIDA